MRLHIIIHYNSWYTSVHFSHLVIIYLPTFSVLSHFLTFFWAVYFCFLVSLPPPHPNLNVIVYIFTSLGVTSWSVKYVHPTLPTKAELISVELSEFIKHKLLEAAHSPSAASRMFLLITDFPLTLITTSACFLTLYRWIHTICTPLYLAFKKL